MGTSLPEHPARYQRQVIYPPLGAQGQRALAQGRVLIVGVGGLGSWAADLLVRGGVGYLRLVDDDKVDLTNLHRQDLFTERDASLGRYKVDAAKDRLARINGSATVEAVVDRLGPGNIAKLAKDIDVILDGTDNFGARFVINDFAVKTGRPWVFAGVVGAEAQTMTIVPGKTPCLRCVFDSPPPPCLDPTCRSVGVLGPAVANVAAIEALEAIKLLAGKAESVSPYLLKMDLWTNQLQRIDVAAAAANLNCPCCKQRHFEYLEP